MEERGGPGWRSLYAFRDEAALDIDQECSNWWSCTYPHARFTTSLFVSRAVGDERHHILDAAYVARRADGGSETTPIADEAQLRALLTSVFGLALDDVPVGEGLDRYLRTPA